MPDYGFDDEEGYEDDSYEPVGSCDNCGCNYYEEEDNGSGLCDQCQWAACGGDVAEDD